MQPSPGKCASCRAKAVVLTMLPEYATELEHDGRTYPIKVRNFEVLKCAHCQKQVIPDESFDRLTEELRRQAGLLAPDEIRKRRLNLGLSQKALAAHLRVAEATISRWETGGQIQQRAMDQLLRLYFSVPEAREHLMQSAGEIGGITSPFAVTIQLSAFGGPQQGGTYTVAGLAPGDPSVGS